MEKEGKKEKKVTARLCWDVHSGNPTLLSAGRPFTGLTCKHFTTRRRRNQEQEEKYKDKQGEEEESSSNLKCSE